MRQVFEEMDADGDGRLDREELLGHLGDKLQLQEARSLTTASHTAVAGFHRSGQGPQAKAKFVKECPWRDTAPSWTCMLGCSIALRSITGAFA